MLLKPNQYEFPTLEAAWEGLNEAMVNNETKIRENGGGIYGTEMVAYDNIIHVFKPYISPDFNFGKILGYRYKKWSKLINNYVNFNYLDLVKSEVLAREGRKSTHYNYTFHFDNAHGSGKDCLISLSFCRRKAQKNPYVIFTTRASEITSRLIFDLLLIQRICEYVYGIEKSKNCEVVLYIPFCYVNIERYLFYMAYKGKEKAIHGDFVNGKEFAHTPFQKRCVNRYDEFMAKDPEKIKYKIHKRVVLQIQKDHQGNPISKAPDLLAKDLTLPFNKKFKDADIVKLNNSLV